jgi:hypothetical protein
MRHGTLRVMLLQHPGKAGTVLFAAEDGIDGQVQHRPAQPAHEMAMQLAVVVVVRQGPRRHAARRAQAGQARIVQHHDMRLRKLRPQPAFPARRLQPWEFRFRVADHQQFPASLRGAPYQ